MRTVYVKTYCGCAAPGIAAACDREVFEKRAAAQLAKGRAKPVRTAVADYAQRKQAPLARKLAKVLRRQREVVKKKVLALYKPPAEKLHKTGEELHKVDKKTPAVRDILAALRSDWIADDLDGYLTPAMVLAYRRGMANGLEYVGIDAGPGMVKQMDAAARDFAEAHGGELITDLAGTTEDDVTALLVRAVEEGMSKDQLAEAIDDMGAFGEARANTIARTELAYAHVQGNVQGWRESGEVVGKRAILGDIHDVPDICDECADAGVVGFDDDFVEGYDFAPFHPNCVCDVVPVLRESGDSDAESDAGS